MKKISICFIVVFSFLTLSAQINPLDSPYYQEGPYSVVMDSNMTTTPDILIFRPDHPNDGPYPTVLFQPGANLGTAYINKHSYDIYWKHLASYGYVVIIMNNTSGGPNPTLFKEMHNWIKTQVTLGSGWMSQYIDLNRFIVSGHSNGGMNATDIIIDRPDEIQAIIYMASYPNPGFYGFGEQNVSNYNGKVYLMCGSEDDTALPLVGTTNEIAKNAFDNRFTNVACKSWTLFNGIGHGGFGDYNNPSQPVGSIGREPATASIRHMLVSFLNSQFKNDASAFHNFSQYALQPNSVGEFENTCNVMGNIETQSQNKNIIIYPNPCGEELFIRNENTYDITIDLVSSTGQILITQNIKEKDTKSIVLKDFPAGIYFIKTYSERQTNTFRFIKL